MPEGDTIYRAARTLDRALTGRTVTRFLSVFPQLTRIDDDEPLRGRVVEGVEARGKHLLIRFSGDLILRTHMRMHGSWHIYRPGERWQRPHHDMRIIVETEAIHAVAFNVPIAEFETAASLARDQVMAGLGPDPLSDSFSPADAVARLQARGNTEIADALLDQRAIAGIGNVYKSELLFAARVNPFTRVDDVSREQLDKVMTLAVKFMRANINEGKGEAIVTYTGFRRTTGRTDPGERLWVYGRGGKPCRRCGTPIQRRLQGPHARPTYWCPRCQA